MLVLLLAVVAHGVSIKYGSVDFVSGQPQVRLY
jgi:hypothetical protein